MPLLLSEIEVGSEHVGKEVWLCSALSIQRISQIECLYIPTLVLRVTYLGLVGYPLFVDTTLLAMNRVTMVDSVGFCVAL